MGRTEPSVGRPPAAFRRDARAKKARATANKLIPSLLAAHPRARRGVEASELIVPPPGPPLRAPKLGDAAPAAHPRLTIRCTDTLTAARSLLQGPGNTAVRVAILNMASPLSPGGGFLSGATSQEESLCMRTTLLPALRDEFYRLPEVGCVYTPDVLVFRASADDSGGGGQGGGQDLLDKRDRWFVDVVSAAMLRLPETEVDEDTGRGAYVHARDRELVVAKMRAVMRVFQAKGAAKVVLGAWGCGAYGNPVGEVARAWRKVLLGGDSRKGKQKGKGPAVRESWDGIEEVVFAVKHPGMAEALQAAFGEELEWADEVGEVDPRDDEDAAAAAAEKARVDELLERISELRIRIDRAPNPRVREGLEAVLAGLESQNPTALASETLGSESGDSDVSDERQSS